MTTSSDPEEIRREIERTRANLSGDVDALADQAVAVGAKAVWFQLGVIDEAAFERTTAAGVPMVMDTCPAIEWRRSR